MPLVAKVRFSSPLPQLDKEFDYLIPEEMSHSLDEGFLVQVPFGSGGKQKTGVVCSLVEDTSPRDGLLTISAIGSKYPILSKTQLELCKAVATRQAGTVGELLSTAIPKRFIRTEEKFVLTQHAPRMQPSSDGNVLSNSLKSNSRVYYQPKMLTGLHQVPDWALQFAYLAAEEYSKGRSSLIVLPDFAEMEKFERALKALDLNEITFRHSGSATGSQQYLSHLKASTRIGINFGLRSACFAPALNLGTIMIWDDGDESHIEQSSPYWHSREVLLQRAELENANLVFSSHSPSSEVVRLIEIGHLTHLKAVEVLPRVKITELNDRLDANSFALISNAIKRGDSVLIQIANAGWASSLICTSCKELRVCPSCASSIWIDPSGKYRCRSCKSNFELQACTCGKTSTRPTRLGASAIAQQMERAFPEATVVHSNGENRLTKLTGKSMLVVATPGADPELEGGYAVVLIADAPRMVGAPRLRALEQALDKWANAISLANVEGVAIFVGLRDSLAQHMLNLDFYSAVRADYLDRVELALPPQTRIVSITSSSSSDHQRLLDQLKLEIPADKTRTIESQQPNTLVLDYSYAYGLELAGILSRVTQSLTKTSKTKKPGERVYRINMDDFKVI